MCGIAGLIHRGRTGDIGQEMTAMLRSLKHRGPDSTGFALYGKRKGDELVLRFKVAEQEDMNKGFDIHQQVKERRAEVDRRLKELGAEIVKEEDATEYAYRYRIKFGGDRRKLADYIEDVEGAEILSIGHGLELIKDLGDASRVSDQYQLAWLHRHPRHRPHPHGDGIRRRHPFRPSLLGLSVRRRVGRSQRPAHQLLEGPPRARASRPSLHVELRFRADRRLPRRQDAEGRASSKTP